MAGTMAQTGMTRILDTLDGKNAYALPSVYLALTSTTPSATAAGTEITTGQYSGYARQALAGASWGASAAGTAAFNAAVDYGTAATSTGTNLLGWEIWDAATGGNRLWWDALPSTAVTAGTHITFSSGVITVTIPILSAGAGFATTYANKMVDHMTGKTAFGAAPTLNAALTTAASTATALGSELTYTGYARTVMPVGSLNAAAAVAASTVSTTSGNGVSPISVTTTAAHGLLTGDVVSIAGVVGNTAANVANTPITVTSPTTFTINGTTGNGAYTSGGTVTPNTVSVASNTQLNFPAATGAGNNPVIGWAFMDAVPALICAGTVTSVAISSGTTPDFPSGSLFTRLN